MKNKSRKDKKIENLEYTFRYVDETSKSKYPTNVKIVDKINELIKVVNKLNNK